MGRTRTRQTGQRLSPAGEGSAETARRSATFRPRLELLEDRIQLGDTVLGLSVVALWGVDFPSVNAPFLLDSAEHDRAWHHGIFSSLDAVASLSLADSRNHVAGSESSSDHTVTASAAETASGSALPMLLENDALAEHMAAYRLAGPALGLSQAIPADVGGTGGVGTSWLGTGVPNSPLAPAASGAPAGRSLDMFAASGAGSSGLGSVSFDVSTGQLAIRADAGEQTVREAVSADGFVDVTLDGQGHSSNPRSVSFDSALSGATAATVAGVRYDGGSHDTLILGSQHLAGGFTVQAAGATVVTENVVAAGPLAIQAANITVSGALQGSTVSLAAPAWVNIDAAGRI